MALSETFKAFRSHIIPPGVPAAVVDQIHAMVRKTEAKAGQPASLDGVQEELVFLANGATKLVAHASAGREQIVAFHFRGDLVSVPARAAHDYTLSALTDCDLLVVPARDFLDLAQTNPALMGEVLSRSMTALRRCREKTVSLGRKTAQERIADFLLTMAERSGAAQAETCELTLPMSRRDIADSMGLTIETVSRQFGELRDHRLLETSGRSTVKLLSLNHLRERAGHLTLAEISA